MPPEAQDADALRRYMEERIRAIPVLALVPASKNAGRLCFRYRVEDVHLAVGRADPQHANAQFVAALRASGIAAASEADIDGLPAVRVDFDCLDSIAAADALLCAAIVLGRIAANGLPVPPAVTTNLAPDGLPVYIGFAGLWRLDTSGLEITRLGPMFEARLAVNGDDAAANMDAATLLISTLTPGNRGPAFGLQNRALDLQPVYRLPAVRTGAGLRVLAIASLGDMTSLTHLDCLLEDSDIELLMLYARPGQPLPTELPEHDVVFVIAGESGPNRPLLEEIKSFTQSSAKRVFNPPERILELSRDKVSARLRSVPGVDMPETVSISRAVLERLAHGQIAAGQVLEGGAFPLIIRPFDSQGGRDLVRLDDPDVLASYLRATADQEFFVSRFVDYRSADGLFRKFRVVLIEGRPFACHMAISTNWMIHYVNADMDESAEKRAEEARFMAEFDTDFAVRHGASLAAIDALLGLDYYGIDCGETADGKLLIFEADTAMLVHAFDRPDLYPYKLPQMHKLFGAFRAMLAKGAGKPGV